MQVHIPNPKDALHNYYCTTMAVGEADNYVAIFHGAIKYLKDNGLPAWSTLDIQQWQKDVESQLQMKIVRIPKNCDKSTPFTESPSQQHQQHQQHDVQKPTYIDTSSIGKAIPMNIDLTNPACEITCVFTYLLKDELIWGQKHNTTSIYLHRIITPSQFRGLNMFGYVMAWATDFCQRNNLLALRLDTWSENPGIINFYKNYGFADLEYKVAPNDVRLPVQNRGVPCVLMEYPLTQKLTQHQPQVMAKL